MKVVRPAISSVFTLVLFADSLKTFSNIRTFLSFFVSAQAVSQGGWTDIDSAFRDRHTDVSTRITKITFILTFCEQFILQPPHTCDIIIMIYDFFVFMGVFIW